MTSLEAVRSNFILQVAYSLVLLSIFSIFVDLLFGIEILVIGSENLAYFYRSIFIFKLLLALLTIFYVRNLPLNPLFWFISIFLFSKIVLGIFNYISLKAYLQHLQFYIYIIIGYVLGWYFWRYQTKVRFRREYVSLSIYLSFALCFIYFIFYQLGLTSRFGLGSQLWILLALVLVYKKTLILQSIIFLTIIFSGKRSLFLIFLAQVIFPKIKLSSIKNLNIFYLLGFLIFTIPLIYISDLGSRFIPFLDLINEYDPLDEKQNRFLAYLATAGRSEEFFAYFVDSDLTLINVLLGVNPGQVFYFIDLGVGGQLLEHEFFHISFLNYLYHFGFIFGSLIIFYQLNVFIWVVRRFEQLQDSLCSLYIPYFLASFFGAIVVIDILFWILFFYCSFLKRNEV